MAYRRKNYGSNPETLSETLMFLENAGKYLVADRKLQSIIPSINAISGASHENSDVQALSLFALLLARVTNMEAHTQDDWTTQVCELLNIPQLKGN